MFRTTVRRGGSLDGRYNPARVTIAWSRSITPGATNTHACPASIGTSNSRANAVRLTCASRPVRYACSGFR